MQLVPSLTVEVRNLVASGGTVMVERTDTFDPRGVSLAGKLAVNPSLIITAQSERAIAFWPNNGDEDQRLKLGSAYRRIAPVAPRHPAVPETAPAALRLPIVAVSRTPI
jgi:hypothetical protein